MQTKPPLSRQHLCYARNEPPPYKTAFFLNLVFYLYWKVLTIFFDVLVSMKQSILLRNSCMVLDERLFCTKFRIIFVSIQNQIIWRAQPVTLIREGVQSSSNSNHRHPNLFCGKRAPQLVITVKFCFLWFEFNALLTQFSTSTGVLWHLYWLKLNFQIIFRFVWSTKTKIVSSFIYKNSNSILSCLLTQNFYK